MAWNSSFLVLMASLYLMNLAIAKNPCKTKVSVPGMALKGFVFKKVPVSAPRVCDITCERETICQSYNYVIGEKSCELNSRTKEARPENFQPDDLRFYMGRISGRTPLGSISELTALSCQEIKLSEGKDSISKKYWLDPANVGSSELVYCDMILEDIDECKGSNNVNCDENANCSNTVGSYNCTCKDGFTGDGHSCSDIDECKGNHSCHVNAKCNNTLGSHICECQPGYTGNGRNSTGIDECKGNHSCHVNAICTNAKGLYVCTCHPGYTGNGRNCTDINECKGNHSCHVNATCMNTKGSYVCTCHPGYTGNGSDCTDINECKGNHSCHVNATCMNTLGSHSCQCHAGYTGNGQNCSDIDECKGNHSCHVNATCTNTNGSYVCVCEPGFNGNGQSCTADHCYDYKSLTEANRKISYSTPYGSEVCDSQLPEGWYRFVGAAGTKMPTTRVPAYRCGTDWPGWLDGAHPTVEDGEVHRMVCFSDHSTGCKYSKVTIVKNCGSYFIYELYPPLCFSRYCATD